MDSKLRQLKEACMFELALGEQKIRNGEISGGISIIRSTIFTLLDHVQKSTGSLTKFKLKAKDESGMKDQDKDPGLSSLIKSNTRTYKTPLSWDTIVGQDEAKLALREALEYPLMFDWYFKQTSVSTQGVLLYGPPGVAKSKLAEVAASNSKATFIELAASCVKSKYFGESEKLLKELFSFIRSNTRTVVFIDEIDGMFPSRGNNDKRKGGGIVNEFLINMKGNDNTSKGWFVIIGATNFPQNIDAAILRRFQKQIRLQMPKDTDRKNIIRQYMGKHLEDFMETDMNLFGKMTEGFSGSDIKTVMESVLLVPLRQGLLQTTFDKSSDEFRDYVTCLKISKDDVVKCVKSHNRTVSKSVLLDLDRFEQATVSSCKDKGLEERKKLTIAKRLFSWF